MVEVSKLKYNQKWYCIIGVAHHMRRGDWGRLKQGMVEAVPLILKFFTGRHYRLHRKVMWLLLNNRTKSEHNLAIFMLMRQKKTVLGARKSIFQLHENSYKVVCIARNLKVSCFGLIE